MAANDEPNRRTGSTTWAWKRVKVTAPPPGGPTRQPKAGRWWGCARRNPRDRLTITIKYRGGSEAWWHIEARGRSGAFPGWMGLHDVMAEINRDPEFFARDRDSR